VAGQQPAASSQQLPAAMCCHWYQWLMPVPVPSAAGVRAV
jgi:hypothetical protein